MADMKRKINYGVPTSKICPCIECKLREVGCHGTCIDYRVFKEKQRELNSHTKTFDIVREYANERHKKVEKMIQRYKKKTK